MWELLIANHLDQPIIMIDQSEILSCSQVQFITLFFGGAPFTSHRKLHEFDAGKPIARAKPAHFDILTINFTVWSHILSTGGDALRTEEDGRKDASGAAGPAALTGSFFFTRFFPYSESPFHPLHSFRESSQQLVERVCRFCFVPSYWLSFHLFCFSQEEGSVFKISLTQQILASTRGKSVRRACILLLEFFFQGHNGWSWKGLFVADWRDV